MRIMEHPILGKLKENEKVKIRKEYEVEVSDFNSTKKVLEGLGLKEWLRMKKKRISYALGKVKFDFDKYEGEYGFIPEFMEIEAKDIDTIYKYAEKLGFKKEECKPWTAKDLKDYYSKE